MKKLVICLACLMALMLSGCSTEVAETGTVEVSIEIICTEVLENYDDLDESLKDEKYVPSDGVILKKCVIKANEGDDAVAVLKKAAKEHGINIEIANGYAKSINYLTEKSCGPTSGWVFEVNNEMIMDKYTVTEGDVITWKYVCSFE